MFAVCIIISYFACGVITGLVSYKLRVSNDAEDYVIIGIFWPLAVFVSIFWIPVEFCKYYSNEIAPAKKMLRENRVIFKKVINLIEELPIEDFEEYRNNGLRLRRKEDGKVCSDWLSVNYCSYSSNRMEGGYWDVKFCDLDFKIPDSIFFRKEINVLKNKIQCFKDFKSNEDNKYYDVINRIKENADLI